MKKLLLLAALIFAVSGCATEKTATAPEPAQTTAPAATESATPRVIEATCPVACMVMHCPPPGGPTKKCCPVSPYTQTCS
ncbi:MAG: hypothetical protein WA056_08960 [Gallionella sp.]